MRSRDELMAQVVKVYTTYQDNAVAPAMIGLGIEVLLDIRDLLEERINTLNQHGV